MEDTRKHVSVETRKTTRSGCTGLDNPDEPLKCVFSTSTNIKVGTGTTAKKQQSKLLWFVEQREIDEFGVRKINPQFVPVGKEEIIDQETLLEDYTPEVEVHNTHVEPAMQALRDTVATGDKHREEGKPLSAEMEYTKALDVDETNVRAIFGLGMVYLDRNDKENSRSVFEQLVGMEAAFAAQHKHLFNEFGIALRKNSLYDEAVQYYSRAVELTQDDENLYYNLARAFYENNDWEHAFEFTSRSLDINAYHEQGLALCRFIIALADNESLRDKHNKPPVPVGVAKKASERITVDDDLDLMVEISPSGFGEI